MKYQILLSFVLVSNSLIAEETETTTTTVSDKKNQVIVIQDPHGQRTKDAAALLSSMNEVLEKRIQSIAKKTPTLAEVKAALDRMATPKD